MQFYSVKAKVVRNCTTKSEHEKMLSIVSPHELLDCYSGIKSVIDMTLSILKPDIHRLYITVRSIGATC